MMHGRRYRSIRPNYGTTWLIAMKGHPATGKSAVARRLAQRLRIALIDKDDIKDHILAMPDANNLSYKMMWQLVRTQLALGLSAIAVSPLSYESGYLHARDLCASSTARLLVVETVLAEDEWRRRLEGRQPGYSTHKISGWDAMQEMLRQYNGCWQYSIATEHHLVVDTSEPVERSVQRVLARVTQG